MVNLLQQSPPTLQFAPRIIHTSSRTAAFSALNDNILADPQLVQAPRTYAASKYLATLIMSHFDREYGNPKSESTSPVPAVRCLNVDPGAVQTNVMDEGFRAEGAGLAVYIAIMRWGYWLAFVIVSLPSRRPAKLVVQVCPRLHLAPRSTRQCVPGDGIRVAHGLSLPSIHERVSGSSLSGLGATLA